MRGYLLQPHLVGYRPLDLSGSSYDDVFNEPALSDNGTQTGASGRVEGAELRVPAQFNERFFEALQMLDSGDTPDGDIVVTHHDKDLTRLGLIDADKRPTIKKGDRLASIYRKRGQLLLTVRNPPGLFVTEVRPSGWGHGDHINLWDVVLLDRDTGF